MSFEHLVQYVEMFLGIVLVVKLLTLRLHSVYFAFCCLLIADLGGSGMWLLSSALPSNLPPIDYRIVWLIDRVFVWIFTFWTVALLLNSILENLPGLLAMSQKVFRYGWLLAAFIGVASAVIEYSISQSSPGLRAVEPSTYLGHLVIAALICQRAVSSVSLIAILVVAAFLFWFPVRIPRNLAYFSIGFVIYFFVITFFFLARSFWSHDTVRIMSIASGLICGACYAFWAIFLSAEGEKVPTQINIDWSPSHQQLLLQQLEGLNESLLRAARR